VLGIDTKGRFPNVRQVIPKTQDLTTRLQLDPQDAAMLDDVLPRLPGHDDDGAPITLDLQEPLAVRAKGSGEARATEILLAQSAVAGPPVRLCTDRQYLQRAVRLGFLEFQIAGAQQPVCCRDSSRCYVWMILDAKAVIPPSADVLRINGPEQSVPSTAIALPRREEPMPPLPTNGDNAPDNGTPPVQPTQRGIGDLIAEAEMLRETLHDSYARISRLVAALKQRRRQARAVQQAMASLRQLQFDH
jgi:hypothetical protein